MRWGKNLFRAISINSKNFVYGDYFHDDNTDQHFIVQWFHDDELKAWGKPILHKYIKIIPETLGQYIGRDDINKKRIYEGDLLKYEFEHKVRIVDGTKTPNPGYKIIEIGFEKGSFVSRIIEQENAYYGELPSNYESVFHMNLEKFDKKIGTIHDYLLKD